MLTRITDSDDKNVNMLAELHEYLRSVVVVIS